MKKVGKMGATSISVPLTKELKAIQCNKGDKVNVSVKGDKIIIERCD